MRIPSMLTGMSLVAMLSFSSPPLSSPLAAQQLLPNPDGRIPLGFSVGTSGGDRDTLGLLVVAVTPESPADRAGITEGSRVAAVNGVSLRLTPDEIGRATASDAAMRRLTREVEGARPGVPVVLQVFGGGRRQMITVPVDGSPPSAVTLPVAAARTTGTVPATGLPTPALPTPTLPTAVLPTSASAPPLPTPTAVVPVVPVVPSGASDAAPVAASALPADTRPVMDSAHAATLGALIERLGELQQQLHRLARDQRSLALADTLSDAEDDLATLRRKLRSAEARQARADSTHDVGLPGLRLTSVNADLATYFGEGSASGLLVVQADAAWDPIRAGDVVLRVDGAPADADRLRAAFAPGHRSTIELLRRRRVLTVTLNGRSAG